MHARKPHHIQTIDKAVAHFQKDPAILAVLVGGSIAKGLERDDSDVDLILVVTAEDYASRIAEKRLTLLSFDFHDYPGGYVDAKFVDMAFLAAAAERGSEPTRDSFTGVYPAWSRASGLEELISRIPCYPELERDLKIRSFYAQLKLQLFFLGEAEKRSDPFLAAHASTTMALFSGRLLLAFNRVLFPSNKRLMERVESLAEKPAEYIQLVHSLLDKPTREDGHALEQCLDSFHDWGMSWQEVVDQYTSDSEFNWFEHRPSIAEW